MKVAIVAGLDFLRLCGWSYALDKRWGTGWWSPAPRAR